MKHTIRILTTAAALAAAGVASAQTAGGFIDASNRVVDLAVGGSAIGGLYEQVLAQTMMVESGGQLDGFYLPVACTTGDLEVQVRDVQGGLPGTQVLASIVVPAAQLPASSASFGQFRFIGLHGIAKVRAGETIALVLSSKGECGIARSTFAANYPGGRSYYDARPSPQGTWIANPCPSPDDLPFMLVLI